MQKEYIAELVQWIKKKNPTKDKLAKHKIKLCKKHKMKRIPTDVEIILNADEKELGKVKKILLSKPTRTISGVAVAAIMTKPRRCPHGKCITCPGGPGSEFGDVPQSYTGKEPATRRAIRNKYSAYLQIMNRLEQYVVQGHFPDKVEVIVMGGTFPSYPKNYQDRFVAEAYKAMNDFSRLFFKKGEFDIKRFKRYFELPGDIFSDKRVRSVQKRLLGEKNRQKTNLELEQKKNEKSAIRCVALCIETRPDYAKLKHANQMLRLGATRVELGVQTTNDEALRKIERGHTVEESIKATETLKDLGFKVSYHLMPGLPGAKNELEELKEIFRDKRFRPDMLKIYPCMVLKGTKLYKLWKKKKYKPLTTKKAAQLIAKFKKYVPKYCRISRVQRDIPTYMTEAGVDKTNLRQYVAEVLKKKKIKCRCIRCREVGKAKVSIKNYRVQARHYLASEGNEFFIEAQAKGWLLGYCRLRFPHNMLREEITDDSAIVRELHVLGQSAGIGKKGEVQHRGIGKNLIATAEEIAHTYYKKKMIIISGIGVREYYKKLGYHKEGAYMSKSP